MTRGAALGKCVRPTRVVGDIPADGASRLRRRVRCEVETIRCGFSAQVEIDDSGPNPGGAIVDVDVHRIQGGRDHHDPTPDRAGTSGQSRPCTPRHDRRLVLAGDLYHLGDLA